MAREEIIHVTVVAVSLAQKGTSAVRSSKTTAAAASSACTTAYNSFGAKEYRLFHSPVSGSFQRLRIDTSYAVKLTPSRRCAWRSQIEAWTYRSRLTW